MINQVHSRDATATIRGYMYQFDATILAILRLAENEHLDVEGIEDFDIGNSDPTDLYQCKYYAAQRLTPAEIRDAILPMLKGFLGLDVTAQQKRTFHLYGYYKDSTPGESRPSLQELKDALIQRKREENADGTVQMKAIDLQEQLGITDAQLQLFADHLTIHICEEYEVHKQSVVTELMARLGVGAVEAREHLYPSALSLVTTLATGDILDKRRTTKIQFCSQLMPSRTLLSAWLLRERGEPAFCREMRQKHFSKQNVDTIQRFFIVDCTLPVDETDLLRFLHALRRKWSSHAVRRKPERERFAPYVYLRGLTDHRLIALKSSLQKEGISFVDGYAFAGAGFSTAQIATPQTYPNGVSLRFLNLEVDLTMALAAVTGQCCIYDFFRDAPLILDTNVRYTAIPVNSIPMIEQII